MYNYKEVAVGLTGPVVSTEYWVPKTRSEKPQRINYWITENDLNN